MRTILTLFLAVLGSGLCAQSNTVPGLDGRLAIIDDLTSYGRRGPAWPNGEAGMAMLNDMCNPGSVDIPWYQAMQPNHPKFGFLIVRVADDKIEQINEWSFCKHAFASININGTCGVCASPGTAQFMGLNCSDAYGPGSNGNRTWLGPPHELNPWLGTWNPVGSYFDIGDPSQAGYPAPADGVRSLTTSIFDNVDNRITVDEIDLTTPGASYYYGLQLMHEGEALANRHDNNGHRGFNPVWSGSQWSYPNNSEGFQHGSILDRWSGATVESAGNGMDDGRFFVASKVTPIGGGNFHYEYAIHNVDNSRAGGVVRIPMATGVVASNFTFGDIDTDASNDWSAVQVGKEVLFTATFGNALEWNTIYNFGFDADRAPGAGGVVLDAARPGAGNLSVIVNAEVPGGVILASFSTFGSGCEGSVPQPPISCPELNGTGGTLSNSTNQYEYSFVVQNSGTMDVISFDIYTGTTGGTITRPAHIYTNASGEPASTPLASTTMTVNAAAGFYTATFSSPVTVTGTFYIGYENSPGGYVSNLSTGTNGTGYYRTAVTGNWNQSSLVERPSWRVNCSTATTYYTPAMGINGWPQLGTTYNPSVSDALGSTIAILVSGLSDQVNQGLPLPLPLPNASGCDLLVSADALDLTNTDASGNAQSPITVPNTVALEGFNAYHQWAIWDPAVNGLGIVLSNGGIVTVGN